MTKGKPPHVVKAIRDAKKANAAKAREAVKGLTWDAERVGRLYEIYRSTTNPTGRVVAAKWAEMYPEEAVSHTMVAQIAAKHQFLAHMYLENPGAKKTYQRMHARVEAMKLVVEREAPNASEDFVKGLQGAIFSKLLEDLNNIPINTPEDADRMLDLTERLVRIQYKMRGLSVGDERETETPAQENATDWRKVAAEIRSKH